MASVLSDYIKKEQMLKQLQEELQALENNSELKKELEFKEKLQALMTEHGKLARDVCEMLDPSYRSSSVKGSKISSTDGRKQRPLKVYKNPHTGEVVETRGGNHKVIKEWKAEFGNDAVVGWVIEERA
ncbi:DNA binding protein [Halomonas qinghailakensis]|uniref:DNA binding protein n=2 Tax=Halomonas TaxID=2745 RepID=A0AA46YMR7_9GAMM|nr:MULTISPECIES: histone-like nucleoid-structuring protein, MvaT/MvaU family [Halomonas]UYO73176.1 DNA binding protein [Halomonas sp. ZZQ-149]UYV18713.1 DNA binding protein [Halomonas qaidamensis]